MKCEEGISTNINMSSISIGIIIVVTGLLSLYWVFYGQRKYNEMALPKKDVELKAILFDMDGVIIDSFDAWLNVVNLARKELNLKSMGKEEFRNEAWGTSVQADVKKYYKNKSVEEISALYEGLMLESVDKTRLMPDVTNIIQSARKKGIKTGLVTNSFKSIVSKALEFHKINGCFDAIVTADDVERVKPYPDPLVKVCEKLGIMPQEAFYVGDTKTDYKAGKAAGCVVVGLNTRGDLMISKLSDLQQLI